MEKLVIFNFVIEFRDYLNSGSIIFTSVNLLTLSIQIAVLWYGVITENHKYLQTHIIFLVSSKPRNKLSNEIVKYLTNTYDIFMAIIFFILSVVPFAYTNQYLQYGGREWHGNLHNYHN